jgi:hypothetical protein
MSKVPPISNPTFVSHDSTFEHPPSRYYPDPLKLAYGLQ